MALTPGEGPEGPEPVSAPRSLARDKIGRCLNTSPIYTFGHERDFDWCVSLPPLSVSPPPCLPGPINISMFSSLSFQANVSPDEVSPLRAGPQVKIHPAARHRRRRRPQIQISQQVRENFKSF